ncbi:MAG: MobC family plasmid mobilization relaxosome protein [Eubacteriales bacterium]|nr:MobC family plasmid mobilization relaxosome protein [Eubacteriales bacterium]
MKKTEAKTEHAKFRVTVDEMYILDTRAFELGLSRSEYLRKLCFEREVVIYDFSGLDKLSGEIGKIGVNINQIARKLNQGGYMNKNDAEFLKSSMEMINAAIAKIYEDTLKKKKKVG